MKLKLEHPVKPYKVNQPWGVYRPEVYSQFGFTKHNGTDVALGKDKLIYAPFDYEVVKIGNQPNGGGIFVGIISQNEYDFKGGQARVLLDCLHCEKILVREGEKGKTGDKLAIADNTGFSTGPHTHFQYRWVKWNGITFEMLDKNNANNSFDPEPYYPKPPLFTTTLKQGMRSGEVVRLQLFLASKGFFKEEVTGFFGPITARAVLDFQLKYCQLSWFEKTVLGGKVVGPKTLKALNDLNDN